MYDGTNWILLNTTGECTTGNTYTIDDASVVASRGAEIFNNYIDNVATGIFAHAEGNATNAIGSYSHTEGWGTSARGTSSHAEGYSTNANVYCGHACGKLNRDMSGSIASSTTSSDVFVIGNGTNSSAKSNCFRVTFGGAVYGLSAFNSSGADYAEFFEWEDGNPNDDDRVGYAVTMIGDKIKFASQGDYVLGIVSGNPSLVGNGDEDWLGRWERDDFGRLLEKL